MKRMCSLIGFQTSDVVAIPRESVAAACCCSLCIIGFTYHIMIVRCGARLGYFFVTVI